MLNHLWNEIKEEKRDKLKLVPGNILEHKFEENTFGAIYG